MLATRSSRFDITSPPTQRKTLKPKLLHTEIAYLSDVLEIGVARTTEPEGSSTATCLLSYRQPGSQEECYIQHNAHNFTTTLQTMVAP